ncbi:MAG TPA: preprotein translocase subunit SecE [Pirellulales bacterium]|nr:preprotein translocase subunit SecE [Pirellulales bacterium]
MAKQQHVTADHEVDEQNESEDSAPAISSRSPSPKPKKKDRSMTAGAHWLFQVGLYKRNQGRVIRQLTFAAVLLALVLAVWRLNNMAHTSAMKYAVPFALLIVGGWVVYRLVNLPKFADFLIAVEAEMTKVSWPTRHQLIRSSIVVILTIIGFAVLLWFYDTFWKFLLDLLHV